MPEWWQDPLGGKNCSIFTLLQVFQVHISEFDCFTHRQISCEVYKYRPDLQLCFTWAIKLTLTEKYKNGKGKQLGKQFHPTAWPRDKNRTPQRFKINPTLSKIVKNCQKGRKYINLSYLKSWEIQPGIHPQVLHPSAEKLTPPGGIGKRESSWIHPHSHGRTRGHLKKGEWKRSLTRSRSTLEVSSIKRDTDYLDKKFQQWVTRNIYSSNNNQIKVENNRQ